MGNWRNGELGNFITLKRGFDLPQQKREDGQVPIFSSSGITGTHSTAMVNAPGVITGRYGTIGEVFYAAEDFWPLNTTLFVEDFHGNDAKFIYYFLKTLEWSKFTSASAVPGINRNTVHKETVSLPDIETQRRIASTLSMLDEKIKTNTEINDNLLEQASSIYQAWFEDFILSDGSCPPSWKQGTLAGIADITSGKRPPVKSAEKTDNAIIPIVGAASVMGYTTEANHTDKILVTGRVGTHGVVQRFNSPCWASDNTLVITSAFYEYTFQILQRIDYRTMNRGSTQPLITQGDMNKVPILIPDNETLLKFETLVGQLMKQYQVNLLENDKLAELRDALLPRLMSGELDVSDLDI